MNFIILMIELNIVNRIFWNFFKFYFSQMLMKKFHKYNLLSNDKIGRK